jgi:Ni,Fe-hydrogenase III small subunit/Pyruvate/2-oxoacid:ferredoxin oxidoreductase delta subunit
LQQKHRTIRYPDGPPPPLPDRFRGGPVIDESRCPAGCRDCAAVCPTGAIRPEKPVSIDLGKCLFCTDCSTACPQKAVTCGSEYRLSARYRQDLIVTQDRPSVKRAEALEPRIKKLFGRSLKLRQVSAGGCNACEADTNVLNTAGWDLSRFGIQFVASPRHADGLLITGPVTHNMELALKKTYDALADPKIVIAVGACAISGGPYIDHAQNHNGADSLLPVDLYVPGCPPHPLTILDGLLRLLDRIP